MTAAELLTQCVDDGVTLGTDAEGGLTCRGVPEAVSRLLPAIRQYKPELLALLSTSAANDASDVQALANLKAAANRLCSALGDDDARRAIMLEDCRSFPPGRWEWLVGYLNERANRVIEDADDRRRCVDCTNLDQGGRCLVASRGELAGIVSRRYCPAEPKLLRRCEGYAPGADDVDRRPGWKRWPGLSNGAKHGKPGGCHRTKDGANQDRARHSTTLGNPNTVNLPIDFGKNAR
ncbi:MAG: hypothetical protein H6R26_662 [Proteobacteria bacterium]|nr:hypothetical protein [Pseudomonadota bacterium]